MKDVILAHGLWVPGVVMRPLAARLERAGFCCHTFSYMGAARPMEAHVERLTRMARDVGPSHFVGHSLGGLLVMEALIRHPGIAAGRVVLLGTPARGCYAGRRIARFRLGRWIFGHSAALWRERHPESGRERHPESGRERHPESGRERHPESGRAARWTRPEALGIVAGSVPLGLGRVFGRLPGVNDGAVCLEETTVEGMAERVVLPVGHSAMLISARVAENVALFLAEGRFCAISR